VAPTALTLAGHWTSGLTRSPCAGDWSQVALDLVQTGATLSGQVTTKDGQRFTLSGSVSGEAATISVPLPAGTGECGAILISVDTVERLGGGRQVLDFSGVVSGRCCGTISERVTWQRLTGA
jgi:hypothetical protein